MKQKIGLLPWLVWLCGALFFLLDYIVRVSPSVLTPTLMAEFHTNAFAIGAFSGFFYYAYICMQIPVGILVDRFGPKRLLVVATAICAFSTLLFSGMHSLTMGYASRVLLGFGASFALVGTWKLTSLWFDSRKFALLAGTAQAMGMLGAMIGQGPMAMLYQSIGWRESIDGVAFIFVLLCLFFIFMVKDTNPKITDIDLSQKIKIGPSLKKIMKNKQAWLNCLFVGLLYAPSACFGEQWGASYIASTLHVPMDAAGHATGIMFIGLAIGCPVLGFISDRMQARLPVMRVSILACLVLLTIIIYGTHLPVAFSHLLSLNVITALLFAYGFFNAGIVISYAMAAELNPRKLTGIAMGFSNMASVIVGAIMIPIVGYVLDLLWTGGMQNGARVFSASDYQTAFIALPILFIIGYAVTFFIKETHCQYQCD